MTKQAWQRPVPERTKPQRQFVSHINLTGSRTSQRASDTMTGAARGAQMGYQVSEEQLNEGREHARYRDIPGAASDLFGAGFMGPMRPENFMALSERLMRDTLLWVEFVARSVQRQPPWANMGAGGTTPAGDVQPQADSAGYVAEVASRQPVEITFQPQPGRTQAREFDLTEAQDFGPTHSTLNLEARQAQQMRRQPGRVPVGVLPADEGHRVLITGAVVAKPLEDSGTHA